MTDKEMNIGIFNEISSEKTEEILNKIKNNEKLDSLDLNSPKNENSIYSITEEKTWNKNDNHTRNLNPINPIKPINDTSEKKWYSILMLERYDKDIRVITSVRPVYAVETKYNQKLIDYANEQNKFIKPYGRYYIECCEELT